MAHLADSILLVSSPWGPLKLQGNQNDGLQMIAFAPPEAVVEPDAGNDFLRHVATRIKHYGEGKTDTFSDIPLQPVGTDFQKDVWKALCTIPYGQTRSYKWLAEAVGNVSGYRAVGNANGKNPIPIIIPCHRVVNHNGDIGGYMSGLAIKRQLLALESGNSESPQEDPAKTFALCAV